MTSAEHFFRPGEAMCDEPLLYRACGLDGIFLCNGYEIEYLDGERYTHIKDSEQLHRVIALNLVEHRKTLSPKELKFIRVAMDLTQGDLAKTLGVSSQTVARWEKGQTEIPGPADRMLRIVVMVAMLPPDELAELVKDLSSLLDEIDESTVVKLQFRHDDEWKEAA